MNPLAGHVATPIRHKPSRTDSAARWFMLAAIVASMPVRAELQARDFDRDGSVDAYYDSAQDMTWLADANYAASIGFVPAQRPSWWDAGTVQTQGIASAWAHSLNIGGVFGWRQHRLVSETCTDGNIVCFQQRTELSAMLASEVSLPFRNLQDIYWSDSRSASIVDLYSGAVYTSMAGAGPTLLQSGPLFVWPVHDGDVSPVPEPSVYAAMLIGLAALGLQRRSSCNSRCT